ncbi:sulfatase [Halomarina halobia]|uniref:Sulfatase n=1 Tax=Halomarina halobia TaxID=3033386 RepID=A0ABD6A877_9EURY|nr:sulfatase [Halomarina sp. PSR21]
MANALLVTVGCLRADHVGAYGYDRPTTPTLDRLAAEGIALDGYANSPGTRRALRTIHTGAYSPQFDGVGLPEGIDFTLAGTFRSVGYDTAGFAFNGSLTRDDGYQQGFDRFDDVSTFRETDIDALDRLKVRAIEHLPNGALRRLAPAFYRVRGAVNDGQYRPVVVDAAVVDAARDWIRSREGDWFAWVHLTDAHTPYARWDDHLAALRGDTDVEHVVDPSRHLEAGGTVDRAAIDAYDAGIRSADAQLARLLDAVDDGTTVVVTGDRGEEFGRYHDVHTASLHSSVTQVPFVVRSPALVDGANGRIEATAQHVDVAPTLADATGVSRREQWVGKSVLIPQSDAGPIHHAVADVAGVRVGEWKLIEERGTDEPALYRTPYGEHDGAPTEDDRRADLVRAFERHRSWCEEHRLGAGKSDDYDGTNVSEPVESNPRDLGYVE